jgi:predicted transcriptional regulator
MDLTVPEKISPEGLKVAQIYLETDSIDNTAKLIGISPHEVSDYLNTREVKSYIDNVYLEAGYRNRNKIAQRLDEVIEAKLEQMEEDEMGSTKDIADLIMLAHKVRMDEMKMMVEMEKARGKGPTNATQNNIILDGGGTNYNALLDKIVGGNK